MTRPVLLPTRADTPRWPRLTLLAPSASYQYTPRFAPSWACAGNWRLRSAPTLFNAYADALEWILQQEGRNHLIHYLDDFLLLPPPPTSLAHMSTGPRAHARHLSLAGSAFGIRQDRGAHHPPLISWNRTRFRCNGSSSSSR